MAAAGTPTGAADDPAQLLHVEMDELTGSRAFVADGWLEPEPAEPAHPDPGQAPRHGRERHRQRLGDLGRGHPKPPQQGDHRHRSGSVR
jgi:hypothetical protein